MIVRLEVDEKGAVRALNNVEKETKDVTKEVNESSKAVDGLTGALDKMTGGAVSGFKNLVSGAKSGVASMNSLKVAIAATGVGALVIAIASLTSYFTKTQRGAEQFRKIMGGVGATISVVVDRISMLGEAVVKIFEGKFSEAAEIGKNAFKGIGEEIMNESKAGAALAASLDELEKREADLIVVSAKRKAQIEELRLAAEDLTKSEAERKASIQEAIKLTKEEAGAQINLARERFRIIKEQNALGESLTSDVVKEREAEAALFEVERERDAMLKRLTAKLSGYKEASDDVTKTLDGQRAVTEALAQAETKRLEEAEEEAFNSILDIQIASDQKKRELDLARIAEEGKQAEADRIRKQEQADFEIALAEQVQAAKIGIASNTFGALGALNDAFGSKSGKNAKKSFEISKALGVAQATISGIEAVQNAFKTASGSLIAIAFPAYPFIQAGLAAAFAAARVKTIASQQFSPSGASGGTSITASGGGSPTVPNVSVVGGGINATGQLAQNVADFAQRPARAYVVGQDITTQQQLDRRIRTNATFG